MFDITTCSRDERSLIALGCMDKNGRVTAIGRRVAKLAVPGGSGRLIVEADRLGVGSDGIIIAAIRAQGGIVARVCPMHQQAGDKTCVCWQRLAPGEETSDVIAQLLAYKACEGMSAREMRRSGIFTGAFNQAKERQCHLATALRGKVSGVRSSGNREDILRAVCVGMADRLYHCGDGKLRDAYGQTRRLAHGSVIVGAKWLVGDPLDFQIVTHPGAHMLRLVHLVTKVEPLWRG